MTARRVRQRADRDGTQHAAARRARSDACLQGRSAYSGKVIVPSGRVAVKPVPVITALKAGGAASIWSTAQARLSAPRCACPPPSFISMAAQCRLGIVRTASISRPLESR